MLNAFCVLFLLFACKSSSFADTGLPSLYIETRAAYSYYPNYKPKPLGGSLEPIGIDVLDKGYALSFATGYNIIENIRSELEITYRRHIFKEFIRIKDFAGYKKGEIVKLGKNFGYVHSLSPMINMYVDHINDSKFTPFLGGGLGITRYEEHNKCGNFGMYKPAFQVMSGIDYAMRDNLRLSFGYRYYKMRDGNIKNTCLSPKIKYRTQEFVIGIRYYPQS